MLLDFFKNVDFICFHYIYPKPHVNMLQNTLYFSLFLLLFIGCQNQQKTKGEATSFVQSEKETLTEAHTTEPKDSLPDIELRVIPHNFKYDDTDKKGKYILRNNLDHNISFSSHFTIEKLNGKEWQVLPLNKILVFEDMAYGLDPDGSQEFNFFLSRFLEKGDQLDKGTYRITKETWGADDANAKLNVAGEFTIE